MKTIKSSAEISNLFGNGRRINTPYASLIVLKHEDEHDREGRVAFIAGKKLGNAVWRNRAKRRMRALCQENGGAIDGFDIAFVARRRINEAPYCEMSGKIRSALKKVDVIYGKDNG